MIVKGLFNETDFETLWAVFYDALMKKDDDTPVDILASKLAHKSAYDKIIVKEPKIDNNHILIFTKGLDDFPEEDSRIEEYYDVSLFYKNEIKENMSLDEKIENNFKFEELSYEELVNYIHERPSVGSYAFEFSPWDEILGYEIDVDSMKSIGKILSLATVFYEMTFCGFDDTEVEEELNGIKSLTDEVEKLIVAKENGEDKEEINGKLKTTTLLDLFSDMEFSLPSESEKKLSYLSSIENWKRKYKYIKKYI